MNKYVHPSFGASNSENFLIDQEETTNQCLETTCLRNTLGTRLPATAKIPNKTNIMISLWKRPQVDFKDYMIEFAFSSSFLPVSRSS